MVAAAARGLKDELGPIDSPSMQRKECSVIDELGWSWEDLHDESIVLRTRHTGVTPGDSLGGSQCDALSHCVNRTLT